MHNFEILPTNEHVFQQFEILKKLNNWIIIFRKVTVDDLKETTESEDEMQTDFFDLSHFKLGELISKRDYCKIHKVICKDVEIVYERHNKMWLSVIFL